MRLIKFTIFAVVLSFIASTSIDSQVKTKSSSLKRPASFMIEFNIGYSQPLPNLYGDIGEQFTFQNFGTKTGFGSSMYFKLVVDKKGKHRPYFTFGYDLFLNSDNNYSYLKNNITTQWPTDTTAIGAIPGKSKMWFHIFNAGLGYEFAFVNKSRWTPYANLDLNLNMMFGTYKQTPDNSGVEVAFTYKSAARMGLGVGFGVNGRFMKGFGMNIGVKYKYPNFLLKSSDKSTEVNKFFINDKADVNLASNLNKDRHIMYLQFFVGATFYIGKK